MPIGTSKLGVLGAGLVPGGSTTFNASGTFSVPPGVKKVSVTGRGGTGNPGNAGNPGNSGNFGIGGGGGGGGANPAPGCGDKGGWGGYTYSAVPVANNGIRGGRGGGSPVNGGQNPGPPFANQPPFTGYNGPVGANGNAGGSGTAGSAGNTGGTSSVFSQNFTGGAGGAAGNGGAGGNGGSGGGGGTGGGSSNGPGNPGTGGAGGTGGGSGGNGGTTPFPGGYFRGGAGGGGAGVTNSGGSGDAGNVPNPCNLCQSSRARSGGSTSGFSVPLNPTRYPLPAPNGALIACQGNFSACTTGGTGSINGGLSGRGGNVFCIDPYSVYGQGTANPAIVRSPTPCALLNAVNATNPGLRSGSGAGAGTNAPPGRGGNGGGGGGGRGNAGNAGGGGNAGGSGSAASPSTVNCISVTPGGSSPVTVASGGQIVISWNPQ